MVAVPSNAPRIEALLLLMPLRRATTRDDSDGIVTNPAGPSRKRWSSLFRLS